MVESGTKASVEIAHQWPWLDEQGLARQHPMIFHYTRREALPKILESKGLFATRYNATNDPDELHALRHPMASLMAMSALPLLKYAVAMGTFTPPGEMDIEAVALDEAVKFHDILVRALPEPLPSLTCFCPHTEDHHSRNGLLTMWRLYGRGEGIALGFDTKHLVALTEEVQQNLAVSGIYLDRVLYGIESAELTRRLFQSPDVVQKFAESLMMMLQGRKELDRISQMTLSRFLRLICCSKHPDFSDEREVRLVVQEEMPGKEGGRPRADQPMPERIVIKYLDALREVMVGPGEGQAEAVISTRQMLDAAGMSNVEITTSKIQFRFV